MPKFQIKLQGVWKDFDSVDSMFLERAFNSGRSEVLFESRGQKYDVDFRRMIQRNTQTGHEREIRQVSSDVAQPQRPVPAAAVAAAQHLKFQVNLGEHWHDLESSESAFLERALASGRPEVLFETRGQNYDVDFRRMVQRNTHTGKERAIRQVADSAQRHLHQPGPPAPLVATPAMPVYAPSAPVSQPGCAAPMPCVPPMYAAPLQPQRPGTVAAAGMAGAIAGVAGGALMHSAFQPRHEEVVIESGPFGLGGREIIREDYGLFGRREEVIIERPGLFGLGGREEIIREDFGPLRWREEVIIDQPGFFGFGGREEIIREDFGPFGGREEVIIQDSFW